MKKRIIIMLVIIVAIIAIAIIGYNIYRYPASFRSLSNHSLNETQTEEIRQEILKKEDKKILIAYLSYSGTTKNVATILSEKTGGDLFEIKPQKEYSNVYTQSNSEIRKNEKPTLSATIDNMEEYDIIFVGYPVWWHATPAPINTFLESYDLKGKLIIPFCTSGGSSISETMPTFLDSCDDLAVYGEKRISSTGEIDAWVNDLGIIMSTGQKSEEGQDSSSKNQTDGNTLVVYFSWSGNTRKMAEYMAKQTGGDILEIKPKKPYPKDYNETGEVAKNERDENARPEIENLPASIQQYDRILIGYPIWWHTAPMIIGTFLENYNLTDVEIYPFTQSASMDTEQFENSMDFVRNCAKGAIVHDGLFVNASNTDEILAYLTENGLTK